MGFTGLILVGGTGSRMGKDKSRVEIMGRPMLEWVLDSLSPLADETLAVGSRRGWQHPGITYLTDEFPGAGPLAGIHAGLKAAKFETVFVTSCDAPFICPEVVTYLVGLGNDWDIVVPVHHANPQPLCAVYSRKCAVAAEALLHKGERRVRALFPMFNVRYVKAAELREIADPTTVFFNVNTPADLELAEALARGNS